MAWQKIRSRTLDHLPRRFFSLDLEDEIPSVFGLSSLRMFILNRRFFIARQLLRSCSSSLDAVLLSDSRDVVFQANPLKL